MTEDETEALVRETFRSREHLVAGRNHVDLLARIEPARRRGAGRPQAGLPPVRFRRGPLVAGVTLIAIALIGGIVLATADGPNGQAAGPDTGGPAAGGNAPAGWVWYSSLGMEIAVPAGWAVNDIGCGQSDRPTVARGRGMERACLGPDFATKRVAEISAVPDSELAGGTSRDITLGGVPATVTEGTLEDGRFTAQLAVPSREVYLAVRTTDAAERAAILDSARLVDVDHLGCATGRPAVTVPAEPGATLVPAGTEAVRICLYAFGADRLSASAEVTGADTAWLVNAVNAAPAGRNPDQPPSACLETGPVVPDAVLQFVQPGGEITRLWATFGTCTGRGLDDGSRQAHVSAQFVEWLSGVLHSGLGHHGLG